MKYLCHILFGGALLLGSIILIHNQKNEGPGQTQEIPDLNHIELAAELPVLRSFENRIQPDRHNHMLVHQFNTDKLIHPAFLDDASIQMRFKNQMNMYLELKPDLDYRWGQYFCPPASFDDPPGFYS